MPSQISRITASRASHSKKQQASQESESDSERYWAVKRIIREDPDMRGHYWVDWEGEDPETGRPWRMTRVPREDITDDLLEQWDAGKAERRKRKRKSTMAKNGTTSNITRRRSRPTAKTDSGSTRARSASTRGGRGRTKTEESDDNEEHEDEVQEDEPDESVSTKRMTRQSSAGRRRGSASTSTSRRRTPSTSRDSASSRPAPSMKAKAEPIPASKATTSSRKRTATKGTSVPKPTSTSKLASSIIRQDPTGSASPRNASTRTEPSTRRVLLSRYPGTDQPNEEYTDRPASPDEKDENEEPYKNEDQKEQEEPGVVRAPSVLRKVKSDDHDQEPVQEEDEPDMDVDGEASPRHAHTRNSTSKRRVSFSLKRAGSSPTQTSMPAGSDDDDDEDDVEEKEEENEDEDDEDEDDKEEANASQEKVDPQEEDEDSDDALLKPIPLRKSFVGSRIRSNTATEEDMAFNHRKPSPTISDLGVGHHEDAAPVDDGVDKDEEPSNVEPATRDGPLVWDFSPGEAVSVSQRAEPQQSSASRQASVDLPMAVDEEEPVTRTVSKRRSVSIESSISHQHSAHQSSPRPPSATASSPLLHAAGAKRKRAAEDDAGQPRKRVHIDEDARDNGPSTPHEPVANALAGPSSLRSCPSLPSGEQAASKAIEPASQETDIVEDSLERIERDPDDGDDDEGDQQPPLPRDERDDEKEGGPKPLVIYDAPSSPRELDPWLPWPRAEKAEEQGDFILPSRSASAELHLDRKEKKRRRDLWKMVNRVQKWENDLDEEGGTLAEGVPTTPKSRRQRARDEDQDMHIATTGTLHPPIVDGDVEMGGGDMPNVPLRLDSALDDTRLSGVPGPSPVVDRVLEEMEGVDQPVREESAGHGYNADGHGSLEAEEAEGDFYPDVYDNGMGIDDEDEQKEEEEEEANVDTKGKEQRKALGPIPRDMWTEESMRNVHREQQDQDLPEDINDTSFSQPLKQGDKDDIEAFTSPAKGTQVSRFLPSQEGKPSLGNASLRSSSVSSALALPNASNLGALSLEGGPPASLDDQLQYNVENSPPTLRYPDEEEEDVAIPELNLDNPWQLNTPTRSGLFASADPPATSAHVAARPTSPQPVAGPSVLPVAGPSKSTVPDPDSQDTISSGDLSRVECAPEERMEEEESSRDLEEEMQQRQREKDAAEEARRLLEREETEREEAARAKAERARQETRDAAAREEEALKRQRLELEEQEQIEAERLAEQQRQDDLVRRNQANKDAARKLRAVRPIERDDESMDVDPIPPTAGPSVLPPSTPTSVVPGAVAHVSATPSVAGSLIVANPAASADSDPSNTLPANPTPLVNPEEDLPNDVDQLKALVRALRAAPQIPDPEVMAVPSKESSDALRTANASLLKDKMALTEERDFFRGHYEAQSALANDLIKEKRALEAEQTKLQGEVQVARGQAKDGVALIRATLEGRIEWLEADAEQWRDQVRFMREVELRTSGPGVRADELRRRAAEYPNMEVELQRVKTEVVEERAKGRERDKEAQRASAEIETLRQELKRATGDLEKTKTLLEKEHDAKEQKAREHEQTLMALDISRRQYEQSKINAGSGSQQHSDGQMDSQASSAGIINAAVNALAGGTSSTGPGGSQGAYFCEMDDVGFSTVDALKQHIAERHALFETAPMAT